MDLLKDLPSHNKQNFSRYTQGTSQNSMVKPYIRLKGRGPEEKPQVIVTDPESVLHKELLSLLKRKSLKRSSSSRQATTSESRDLEERTKVPRTTDSSSDHDDLEDMSS